jgi:hypothetical protein
MAGRRRSISISISLAIAMGRIVIFMMGECFHSTTMSVPRKLKTSIFIQRTPLGVLVFENIFLGYISLKKTNSAKGVSN